MIYKKQHFDFLEFGCNGYEGKFYISIFPLPTYTDNEIASIILNISYYEYNKILQEYGPIYKENNIIYFYNEENALNAAEHLQSIYISKLLH